MKVFILMVALCMMFLASCSSDQDNREKGAIDRHNEKVAQEAVRAIKTPLDQAKAAAGQENAHTRQMEDQLNKQ